MAPSSTAPKVALLTSGPWTGVRNAIDEPQVGATLLYHAANCYFPDNQVAGSIEIRPPFVEVQAGGVLGGGAGLSLDTETGLDLITEAGDTLIGDGSRLGQCIFEHVRLDGTTDRFLFVGGRMYRWDGSNTSPVFTDLTPATGPLISPTGRIYCTTFANLLIVTDGVNRPWTYDPATTTATNIQYNTAASAWSAYGPVVIYDSAIVFIVNTVAGVSMRGTMAWSETNSPTTGYAQDNFDDTWTLAQTNANPLTCLVAENAALYYFRAGSIGLATGTIGSSFQTTAQHDGVSAVTGTTTPASVLSAAGYIWFLDYSGDPCRFRIGSTTIETLGGQVRDLIRYQLQLGLQNTQNSAGFSAYQSDLGLVVMASYAGFNVATVASSAMVFDAESGAYQGQWSCGPMLPLFTMAPMTDSSNNPSLCLLTDDAVIAAAATSGAFARMRTLAEMVSASVFYNDFQTEPVAIITHLMGERDVGQWTFERLVVRSKSTANAGTSLTYGVQVPTETAPVATSTMTLNAPGAVQISLVPSVTDRVALSSTVAGLTGKTGRWAQVILKPTQINVTDLPFTPTAITLRAVETDVDSPNVT